MQVEKLPNHVLTIVQNNSGLQAYLNSLERGRAATPRSWLYEGEPDSEVLSRWMKHLDAYRDSNAEFSSLVYQFDTSQLKKWGPQGEVPPIGELMDLVTEGFSKASSPKPKIFSDPRWRRAKEKAIDRLFRSRGYYHTLRPRTYESVYDDMRSRDTIFSNSGFPDFAKRNITSVRAHAISDARTGKWREYPAICLFRAYNGKVRIVWMYPMATNLVEGSFTQPLKEILKPYPFFAPWRGYEDVRAQLTEAYEAGESVSASDFSHADAHFTHWAMLEVFDVIKHAFQPQYWDALKESMLWVCQIPLIFSKDSWVTGGHGVSSGSNFTNDVETIMDFICECFFEDEGLISEPMSAVGDDVAHKRRVYDPSFAEKIAKLYQSMGFDVNAEKVTNQESWVKYLQRLTIKGFYQDSAAALSSQSKRQLRGIYSTIRALNSSLNPEKYHKPKDWNADMFCCRQYMILENTVDHPLFEEFVKFVVQGNRHLLEFAKRTAADQDSAFRASRSLPGLNPTYNQEKRDSKMSSFASIAIARKL